MGMLMHHTWMKQQEEAAKKVEKPAETPVAETNEMPVDDEMPVKKTAGRRKVSK